MASPQFNSASVVLRSNVTRFLRSKARLKAPLLAALNRLTDKGMQAVLFGGTLRDLMLRGPSTEPRDVDVVVDTSVDELTRLFADILVRKTRFGGLHLNARGWMIDVWPLSETWAFRELNVGSGDFEALTRTTFLNVEAATVDLGRRPGGRRVYACGFFEAVKTRTLDINLEENPFPQLAAIRALITASALNYGMSTRLAKYVAHYLRETPPEHFLQIQASHYGWIRCDINGMRKWSRIIKDQIGTQTVVRGLSVEPCQLTFWYKDRRSVDAGNKQLAPIPSHSIVSRR